MNNHVLSITQSYSSQKEMEFGNVTFGILEMWRRRTWEKNLLILMINNFTTVIIEKYDVVFRCVN